MRLGQKKIDGFVAEKTVYSPTNEYRHCLHIFAAISKELISVYALNSCKKQIVGLSPLHFKIKQSIGRRENPTTVYIDKELDEFLEKFGRIPRSHVLEKCLILEVDERISKWGCKTPQQFIDLMASSAPLKLLELPNDEQSIISPTKNDFVPQYAQVAA